MVSIARKNLFHDKGRLATTLIGLAAALVLVLFGMGMFLGTIDESVIIVDHVDADLWVLQDGNKNVLSSSVIQPGMVDTIAQVDGVAGATPLIYMGGSIERGGDPQSVMVVGVDLDRPIAAPWKVVDGSGADLGREGTVIVDESMERKLGQLSSGDRVAINGTEEEVAGLSRGAKWFISPFVFTSLENARSLCRLMPGETGFILVKVELGRDPAAVAAGLSQLDGIDALTRAEVRRNTRNYMIFESGMGLGVGTMVVVGLFVAMVIVSLTIYTATMERIPEFGTLKAIGASRGDLARILLEQTVISVSMGYVLGALVGLGAGAAVSRATMMTVKIDPLILVLAYVSTLLLALVGSFSSLSRVNRVDPAIVFRG